VGLVRAAPGPGPTDQAEGTVAGRRVGQARPGEARQEIIAVEGPKDAIRLGLTHVKTVREATAAQILAARNRGGPFKSLSDFMRRAGIRREPLDNLIDAGALLSLSEGHAHRHPEALEGNNILASVRERRLPC